MIPSKRIVRERAQLVLKEPFLGRLILRLEMVENKSIPTAATDGAKIYYNPAWIDTLSDPELRGLLVHEVMHCSQLHPFRREWRDHDKWNVAGDLSINSLIREAGFVLPKGALLDKQFTGDAAERIYSLIPDPPKDQESGGRSFDDIMDPGQGQGDDAKDGQGQGQVQDRESAGRLEEEWREATIQAATEAAKAGKVPLGMERLIRRVAAGRVDWRSLLRQFLNQVRASDYSWSRPSRRHISSGLILPSMRSVEAGLIIFGFDTSGSMDDRILAASWAECVSALEDIKPEAELVAFDSKVQRVEHVEPGDALPDDLNLPGGGGTDFRPIFKRIDSEGWSPSCLVVFTDLEGRFPDVEPGYPVLWIADNDRSSAPFGITLPVLS